MPQRGVHFALLPEDVQKLQGAEDDDDLRVIVQDDIESRWDEAWLFQTDKGWAAIHRCLTDGRLAFGNGAHPLRACVLGGEQLYHGEGFIVSFLTPEQVKEVASALEQVDKNWFRAQYLAIDPTDYGTPLSDEDFEYVWSTFAGLPEFFARAGAAERAVIFTVDV